MISPAILIVSRTGTVHIIAHSIDRDRIKACCGFTQYKNEEPFEPVRHCLFCWQEAGPWPEATC
jgi:hypothetical protein